MFNWWMFFVVDVTNGVEHIANQWGYEAQYNRYKSYVIPGETLIPGGRGEAFGQGIGYASYLSYSRETQLILLWESGYPIGILC